MRMTAYVTKTRQDLLLRYIRLNHDRTLRSYALSGETSAEAWLNPLLREKNHRAGRKSHCKRMRHRCRGVRAVTPSFAAV